MTTSEIIKFLCQGQNISLSELARRIGQTRQNLSKKLVRETLTVDEIKQIAGILGSNFEQIFTLPNGVHIHTDQTEETKSQIVNKALWSFYEIIQNKGYVLKDDVNRLLNLFLDIYDLDIVYLLEFSPDNRGYIFKNIVTSSPEYAIKSEYNEVTREQLEILVSSYNQEHLSTIKNPKENASYIKSIIHYGFFRRDHLDGCVGFIDCHLDRKWSNEEKGNLLRLGRTLHHYITSSRLEKLNDATNQQMDILSAMTEIYDSVHVIDLQSGLVYELGSNQYISPYSRKAVTADEQIFNVLNYNTILDDRERVMEFANLSTLEDRMKYKKSIVIEFRGLHLGWTRAQFIVVERDSEGFLKRVAFTIRGIDEQKRKMDRLLRMSTTDELTQLNNRHAYDEDIGKYEMNGIPENTVVAAFDVNGLKMANDEYGHEAGDELIRGTAFCITAVFGMVGKLYRTGGDEFMCIMQASKEELNEMIENFSDIQKAWKGLLVKNLSISAGYASAADYGKMEIHELLKQADKLMYQNKRQYYLENKIERRHY